MKLNVTVELVETGAISRGGKRVLKGEALVDGVKLYVTAYAAGDGGGEGGAAPAAPAVAVAKRVAPVRRAKAGAGAAGAVAQVAQPTVVADDSAAKLAAVLTKLDTLPPDIRAALNLG